MKSLACLAVLPAALMLSGCVAVPADPYNGRLIQPIPLILPTAIRLRPSISAIAAAGAGMAIGVEYGCA